MNLSIKRKIMKNLSWIWGTFSISLLTPNQVLAFNKLKNGFESLTNDYLIPLSSSVAGAAFVLFVVFSYFKQEEYVKKIGMVLVLSIFSAAGLELINTITESFS